MTLAILHFPRNLRHKKQKIINKLQILINKLNNDYSPKKKKQIKINENNDTLKSAKSIFFIKEEHLRAFKRVIFPYIDGFKVQKESDKESDGESDENDEIDTTDMADSESEESTVQQENEQGQGLKILTPNQILSRLLISLAQLKAGNNSEKLENEIRQLLHSLYK